MALKISSLEKVDFSTDKNLLSDYHISSDTVLTALAANYPSQVLRIRLTSLLHHAALLDMRFLLEDMIRYASPFATDDGNSTIIITDDNPNDNRHLSAIGMSETLAMSFVGGFIIMAIFEKYRFYKQIYLKRLQNRFRVSELSPSRSVVTLLSLDRESSAPISLRVCLGLVLGDSEDL